MRRSWDSGRSQIDKKFRSGEPQDSVHDLIKRFADLDTRYVNLESKIDLLCEYHRRQESENKSSTMTPAGTNFLPHDRGKNQNMVIPRPPRFDFPRFEGGDPIGWIFKVEQYFDFHHIPEDQKLTIVLFYMDGDALAWFQLIRKNTKTQLWDEFIKALTVRFGPSGFEDPKGAIAKQVQISTLAEYQSDFEKLSNQNSGLSEDYLLSFFISGLRQELKREVAAFQPTSMSQAIGLAKLLEEKLLDGKKNAGEMAVGNLAYPEINLEDKVACQVGEDDTTLISIPDVRPKRSRRRPAHLEQFLGITSSSSSEVSEPGGSR